jgi:hypothetical protein
MRLLLIASFVCGLANGKGAEGTEPKAHVTIHLIDRANVPADVMAQAIVEASRIFQPTAFVGGERYCQYPNRRHRRFLQPRSQVHGR